MRALLLILVGVGGLPAVDLDSRIPPDAAAAGAPQDATAIRTPPAGFPATSSQGSVPTAPAARSGDTLRVRVVDVGAGLCTITRAPGGAVMVYDAGHWQGQNCLGAVRALVPQDTIDLLVLSHSDADHLGDAARILEAYTVRQIVWTGHPRPDAGTWRRTMDAIVAEVRTGASVRSFASLPLSSGEVIPLGPARVRLLAGWHRWEHGVGLSESERRNALSIVLQVSYRGATVLYAGDTVGRRIGDPADACKDAEAWMVGPDAVGVSTLRSDVLIAPHHGADNASSTCFIEAVSPEWVVFSAGHDHAHPRAAAAQRYLAHGIAADRLFRTDRGDDEGGLEWGAGRVDACQDRRGDDDVEILLLPDGSVHTRYVSSHAGC